MPQSECNLQNPKGDLVIVSGKAKSTKPSSQHNTGVILPDLKTRGIENTRKMTDPTLVTHPSNVTNLIKQED